MVTSHQDHTNHNETAEHPSLGPAGAQLTQSPATADTQKQPLGAGRRDGGPERAPAHMRQVKLGRAISAPQSPQGNEGPRPHTRLPSSEPGEKSPQFLAVKTGGDCG